MSYLDFLLFFVLLPALILAWISRPSRREWIIIGLLVLVAYLWTTPWDNYLVATGVWSYDPHLVLGITLGWVPLEEYLFFGFMTVLSGCATLILQKTLVMNPARSRAFALLAAIVLAVALMTIHPEKSPPDARPFTYLILISIWSVPVVLGQIALGWKYLFQRWPLWVLAVLLPTFYLTAMDSIALNAGTWQIDPRQSLNLFLPGRIPIEEGFFFLMTNFMIVQGLLLALDPQLTRQLSALLHSLRSHRQKYHDIN